MIDASFWRHFCHARAARMRPRTVLGILLACLRAFKFLHRPRAQRIARETGSRPRQRELAAAASSAVGILVLTLAAWAWSASDDEFVPVPPVWPSGPSFSLVRIPALCEALDRVAIDRWDSASVDQRSIKAACASLNDPTVDADWRTNLANHLGDLQKVVGAAVNVRTYCGQEKNKKEELCNAIAVANGMKRTVLRMSPPARDEREESFSSAMPLVQKSGGDAKLTGSVEQQFIEGLTNFVLDRAKLEAILHFEERFRDKLCVPPPDGGPQVGYFPAVCNVLGNASEAGFSVAAASRELRASARADLKELPDNVLHQKYVETGDYIWEMSRVWFALVRALRDGRLDVDQLPPRLSDIDAAGLCWRNPAWPNASFEPSKIDGKPLANLNAESMATCSRAIRGLAAAGSLLAASGKIASGSGRPAEIVDAVVLLSDATVESKIDGAKFDLVLQDIEAQASKALELKDEANRVRLDLAAWRDAESDARRNARRAAAQTLLDAAEDILALTDKMATAIAPCDNSSCGFGAGETSKHILRSVATVRKYDNIIVSIMENDWADVASRFSELFLHESGPKHVEAVTGRFAPVVSELAGAQSAVEVQGILNNAAAPAGSYREKFQGRTRSLTAFAGASVGREKNDGNHQWGNTRGLFLPVGLDLTWPCERSCYGIGKGARGAFFSLIDLGPYVDYRDSGAGVERDSKLGLRQLFAPGAYLTWNISTNKSRDWKTFSSLGKTLDDLFYRSPFVFGIGIARAPALIDSVTGQRVEATRVQAFFAIDVTLFPF